MPSKTVFALFLSCRQFLFFILSYPDSEFCESYLSHKTVMGNEKKYEFRVIVQSFDLKIKLHYEI